MTTNDPLTGSEAPEPPLLVPEKPGKHDPYAALRHTNYRRYIIGNAFSLVGTQMAGVTIGWELYGRTHSAAALGMVGLVQIIPIVLLALPAGHIIDRVNRKQLILFATGMLFLLYIAMGAASRFGSGLTGMGVLEGANRVLGGISWMLGDRQAKFTDPYIPILFCLLLLSGMIRAINQPAKQTLMPMLVPPRHFSNAVAWNTSLFEGSNMVGPTVAGFAIWALHGSNVAAGEAAPTWAFATIYWVNAGFQLVQFINFATIKLEHESRPREPMTLSSLTAGVHFVFGNKIILGAMALDMFAVLLGGATALLPLFARDILHVGSAGYGWLRAAPSIGAISTAMIVAHMPPMKKAGRNMMWAVVGFGAATIVFGLSRNFWLSMAALVVTGMCDNISVVVRHTLVQLLTPDHMRGRVNAVNSVFISCSNELGAFESGATAAVGMRFLGPLLGPMVAVAGGGVGTIAVVGVVALAWPQVRAVRQLTHIVPEEKRGFPVQTKRK